MYFHESLAYLPLNIVCFSIKHTLYKQTIHTLLQLLYSFQFSKVTKDQILSRVKVNNSMYIINITLMPMGKKDNPHLRGTAGPGSCQKSTMSGTNVSYSLFIQPFSLLFLWECGRGGLQGAPVRTKEGRGAVGSLTCALSLLTGLYDFPECVWMAQLVYFLISQQKTLECF